MRKSGYTLAYMFWPNGTSLGVDVLTEFSAHCYAKRADM